MSGEPDYLEDRYTLTEAGTAYLEGQLVAV